MAEPIKLRSKKYKNIGIIILVVAIILAIIIDLVAFSEIIIQFIGAIIFPIIVFVFLFVAMIFSLVFIFGIYIIEEYGFWPLTLAIDFFKEIIGDINYELYNVPLVLGFRYAILALCVVALVFGIIAKVMIKKDIKDGVISKNNIHTKGPTGVIVFSVLGILAAIGVIAILSSL